MTFEAADPSGPGVTFAELQLAARNHALPLEALRYPLTPPGLHFVLVHYDVPFVEAASWSLEVGGAVRRPATYGLDDLTGRTAATATVTLECAGNGRALLTPRALSQPWLTEAVGTAAWTGVPLRELLEEAGLEDGAHEVVFRGLDHGIEGGVEQDYERSLSLSEALRDDVLLAYAMNGQPLPPQHGFPLRLVVPGWYGMTQVKWLAAIEVVREPFAGYQQRRAYRMLRHDEDEGRPVARMRPRSLLIPPGVPDFFTRRRHLPPGPCLLQGRAWSGTPPIVRVEVSTDGGRSFQDAVVDRAPDTFAWAAWSCSWDAVAGEHELCSRATDAHGNVQPMEPEWNLKGYANNAWQRVPVRVLAGSVDARLVRP